MSEKNGRLIQILVNGFFVILVAVGLYVIGDIKTDLREVRKNSEETYILLTNELHHLGQDVAKIKGKLGIDND